MKIAVAVSGGVDSLYTLLNLHKEHEVIAIHALFFEQNNSTALRLEKVCNAYGIKLIVLDLKKEFKQKVLEPFINTYNIGQTPNPCAICNANMKFGLLLDAAIANGCEKLATGHYATMIEHESYGYRLKRGHDASKDQSYFLALTPINNLLKVVFPLAREDKSNIIKYMQEHQIEIPVPKESQEICFVPNDDYKSFLLNHGVFENKGKILHKNGKELGLHTGLWNYTEGQRKGLGIAWTEGLYVYGKNIDNNSLIVAERREIETSFCRATNINYHVEASKWSGELYVQTRYRQKAIPSKISFTGDDMLIEFSQKQTVQAKGQVAVVYDADGFVLAGGIII